MATKSTPAQTFHVPGLSAKESSTVVSALQDRLFAYTDLHLVLKHVHWNVVGPNFIGVHEMLDPQVDLVRGYADAVAERIATMGGTPIGTRAPWSRLARGTTTPSARTPPRPTSARSTSSTPASSRTTARRSTSSARSTR